MNDSLVDPPVDWEARILYEDHHLIAVNKPAPLLTQAPPGIPSLESWVKSYIKVKYAKPAGVYLGIPHRLDRAVSGVVVFARNTKAAQKVHRQFQDRSVEKTYWALAHGLIEPSSGLWLDYLGKLTAEARVVPLREEEPQAKKAETHYRVMKHLEAFTLLELKPVTGRMHQLRVQAAWRGHPLVGDALYGHEDRFFGPAWSNPRDKVIALHARELIMYHPFSQEKILLHAPLPAYWPNVEC